MSTLTTALTMRLPARLLGTLPASLTARPVPLALALVVAATLALLLAPDAALAVRDVGGGGGSPRSGASASGKNLAEFMRSFIIPIGYTAGGAACFLAFFRREFFSVLLLLGMGVMSGMFLVDGGVEAILNMSSDAVNGLDA